MTYTATELAAAISGELGDSDHSIWTEPLLLDYIEDTLYDFKMRTFCDWRRMPLNNIIGQATYPIPDSYDFHQLERAEEDYWAVTGIPPRVQMAMNGYFESAANRPLSLMMQGDGIQTIRKIGVPTTEAGVGTDYVFCESGVSTPIPLSTTTAWLNPDSITQDGGIAAQNILTPNIISDYLVASEFDFDAPDDPDTEIQGITVAIELQCAGGVTGTVRLVKDGAQIAAKNIDVPTTVSEVTVEFGPADWDITLMASDINDPTFSVTLSYRDPGQNSMIVDYIKAFYSTSRFIIEYFAAGEAVASTPDEVLNLPQRYLTYIGYGVKARAYAKDGDGQSLKLSGYWASRYEDAITMMERRRTKVFRRRVSNIGHDGKVPESGRRRDPGSLPAYFPKVE